MPRITPPGPTASKDRDPADMSFRSNSPEGLLILARREQDPSLPVDAAHVARPGKERHVPQRLQRLLHLLSKVRLECPRLDEGEGDLGTAARERDRQGDALVRM